MKKPASKAVKMTDAQLDKVAAGSLVNANNLVHINNTLNRTSVDVL